jgi:hypothetical protein
MVFLFFLYALHKKILLDMSFNKRNYHNPVGNAYKHIGLAIAKSCPLLIKIIAPIQFASLVIYNRAFTKSSFAFVNPDLHKLRYSDT